MSSFLFLTIFYVVFFYLLAYDDFFFFFFLMIRPPPRSPLFPSTPLSRSSTAWAIALTQHNVAAYPSPSKPAGTPLGSLPLVFCRRDTGELVQRLVFPAVVSELAVRLARSEEHTSELQSPCNLVFRLLLEK